MWKMLYNGKCPPPELAGFKFVQVTSGQVNQAAIDNQGRLFTWGAATQWGASGTTPIPIAGTPNFSPNPAIYYDPLYWDGTNTHMLHPYQVGTKSDWIKVIASEYTYMAIDSEGKLYCWGEGFYGNGGWERDEQYDFDDPNNIWQAGGSIAIIPTLVNNDVWKDFALGWYHVLAQKSDGTLWIWGENNDDDYGSATYPDNFISRVPIQMTWLPANIKLFDCDWGSNIIVTADDQVYVWGTNYELYPTPTLKPLTLPGGVTIIKCECSWAGACVLLSNGEVWGLGWAFSFVNDLPPPQDDGFDFRKVPGGHFFVDLSVFSQGAAALDNQGNIWGWGTGTYTISRGGLNSDDPQCDMSALDSTEVPLLTAVDHPTGFGTYNWKTFALGGWTHCAIDTEGKLFTWGSNAYGELGVNDRNALDTCKPMLVVDPTLDDGTLVEGILVG